MTDQQINYIGFAVLAALFWYVQIYRPRKKMRDPGELILKPVMNRDDRDMYESIRKIFPAPYILKSNVSLDDLLYSPAMEKKPHFHKALRQQQVAWLVLDSNHLPQLAVDYSAPGDDMKLNYLSRAGVGCCIFTPGTAVANMEESLQEAAEALSEMQNGQTTDSEQPVTA
ncbi:hypothetical protein ID026_004033 [Salmonella enterica]|nr:hypothetical protein [Salmonella enterica]